MAIERGICTVADVELLTRPPRSYSNETAPTTATKPTLAEVERWIDKAIDEIYADLDGFGIITPIVETTTKRLVAQVNAVLAAKNVIASLHQTVEPNATPYSDILLKEYERLMKMIRSAAILPTSAKDSDRPVIPKSGGLYSRMKELWDTDEEDTAASRGPLFKISKEF